jgi:NTE family protein
VLQVLRENNIPVDFIVGSSMGAMVGSIYAAGGDIYMTGKLASALNVSLFWDVGLPKLGFVKGDRVEQLLRMLTKGKSFDQLDLPLAIVATDIESGQRIVIREGPVYRAVRASGSLPGVFEPVRLDGRLLVDGAVSDRLPVSLAWEMGATLVLGVVVTFPDDKKNHIRTALDVIFQAIELLEKQIFENLVRSQASVLLQPRLGNIKSTDFARAEECVAIGRECTLEKLDEIRAAIEASENKILEREGVKVLSGHPT